MNCEGKGKFAIFAGGVSPGSGRAPIVHDFCVILARGSALILSTMIEIMLNFERNLMIPIICAVLFSPEDSIRRAFLILILVMCPR